MITVYSDNTWVHWWVAAVHVIWPLYVACVVSYIVILSTLPLAFQLIPYNIIMQLCSILFVLGMLQLIIYFLCIQVVCHWILNAMMYRCMTIWYSIGASTHLTNWLASKPSYGLKDHHNLYVNCQSRAKDHFKHRNHNEINLFISNRSLYIFYYSSLKIYALIQLHTVGASRRWKQVKK